MPDDIDNEEEGEGSEEAEAILADVPLEWDSLWPRVSAILQQLGDLDAEDLYLTLRYAPGPDVFSTVASSTKSYAQERAAELVGKKDIDGQLVGNPDPEFAITDATREMLRGLVNDALEQGWSAAKVRDEIIQSYAFSPTRALNIARTERSLAQNRGSLVAAKASGVVDQKRSELASEHPQDDECDLNAAQGWIDIDEPFESGDDCAPFHPSCACGTVYRQAPSDTGEGEPIEESATPLHDRLAKLAELYDSSGRRVWGAETVYKYNPNHDDKGRFAEGDGDHVGAMSEEEFRAQPNYIGSGNEEFPKASSGALPTRLNGAWRDVANSKYVDLHREISLDSGENSLREALGAGTVEELSKIADDPRFVLQQDAQFYTGVPKVALDKASEAGEIAFPTAKYMALTEERAARYAGDDGAVLRVTAPKGTRVIMADVFDQPEAVLLPGSRMTLGATAGGRVISARVVDDGTEHVKQVAALCDSIDEDIAKARKLFKYNENHDPATGRFAEGEGLILTHTGERVFNGEPVPIESKPSKLEVGALGEKIAIAYARQEMGAKDVGPLNTKANNFPVDMLQDHQLIEVKTGLCSNGKTAQHWRATIGQPGKEESAWLKTASKEDKAAWNQQKSDAILQRKQATLDEFSKRLGTPVAGKTLTIILNPDTRSADIHIFDGFHSRIPWNSDQAKAGYVGTFRY